MPSTQRPEAIQHIQQNNAGIHTEAGVASAACPMVGMVTAVALSKVFASGVCVACTASAKMKARVTPVTMMAPTTRAAAVSAMLRAMVRESVLHNDCGQL